jgi:hypothetical protein
MARLLPPSCVDGEADEQAWKSALRLKPCFLAIHEKLRKVVASKLIQDRSPLIMSAWALGISHGKNKSCLVVRERSGMMGTIFRHHCDEEAVDEIPGREARPHGVECFQVGDEFDAMFCR